MWKASESGEDSIFAFSPSMRARRDSEVNSLII